MVDNLLDTTRIEEGRHEMTTEETDLRAAVEGVVESFAPRAAQHSIEIGCHLPDAVSLAIDRQALDTILRNLVDNALKACIAGDGHRIDVNLERGAGRIELRVTDDGLGFAPEESSLMFEKFHRLGDELRRKTPGTGLGLYLVKKLAELSGASIRAESQGAGTGAAIALSWPERGTT
jgi:signal transduction histidine kinase